MTNHISAITGAQAKRKRSHRLQLVVVGIDASDNHLSEHSLLRDLPDLHEVLRLRGGRSSRDDLSEQGRCRTRSQPGTEDRPLMCTQSILIQNTRHPITMSTTMADIVSQNVGTDMFCRHVVTLKDCQTLEILALLVEVATLMEALMEAKRLCGSIRRSRSTPGHGGGPCHR